MKRVFLFTPFFFLGGFFVFYIISALKWPGGHQWDPDAGGYSFVYNYFCDHLRHSGMKGVSNSGRPSILISLGFLIGSFLTFWTALVNFWFFSKKLKYVFNLFGLAILVSFCMLPVYHDPALLSASLLAFAGFLFLHIMLFRHQENDVLMVTFIFTIMIIINFYLWHFQVLLTSLPLIQKFTFIGYAFWVGFISIKVIAYNRRR